METQEQVTIDRTSSIYKQFKSTAEAMAGFYDNTLMKNGLFTTIRNQLLAGKTTVKEVKENITHFNKLCKEQHKFTIYTAKHKVFKWMDEFEEARKE